MGRKGQPTRSRKRFDWVDRSNWNSASLSSPAADSQASAQPLAASNALISIAAWIFGDAAPAAANANGLVSSYGSWLPPPSSSVLAASNAASSSFLSTCPSANRSATSSAFRLRQSASKCQILRQQAQANNRNFRSLASYITVSSISEGFVHCNHLTSASVTMPPLPVFCLSSILSLQFST